MKELHFVYKLTLYLADWIGMVFLVLVLLARIGCDGQSLISAFSGGTFFKYILFLIVVRMAYNAVPVWRKNKNNIGEV
jgi:hypothetical protein